MVFLFSTDPFNAGAHPRPGAWIWGHQGYGCRGESGGRQHCECVLWHSDMRAVQVSLINTFKIIHPQPASMKDETALLKGTHTLWIGIQLSICALTPDLWGGDETHSGRHCSLCIYGYLLKVQDASRVRSQEGELLKPLPVAPSDYSVPARICFKPVIVNVNGSW